MNPRNDGDGVKANQPEPSIKQFDTSYSYLTQCFQSDASDTLNRTSSWFYLYHKLYTEDDVSSPVLAYLAKHFEPMAWRPEQQLFLAAKAGDLVKIKELVEKQGVSADYGFMVDFPHEYHGLLRVVSVAIQAQQWEVASYLVAKGADLHAQPLETNSPMLLAFDNFAQMPHEEAGVQVLQWVNQAVLNGYDLSDCDRYGDSVLTYAIRYHYQSLFNYCLQNNVDVNLRAPEKTIPVNFYGGAYAKKLMNNSNGEQQNVVGFYVGDRGTPLQVAVANHRYEMVKALVEYGAHVDEKAKIYLSHFDEDNNECRDEIMFKP